MNKRIEKLAEQAGMSIDKYGLAIDAENGLDDGVDIYTFAKLILQECLQLCKDAQTAYLIHGMSEREADGAISVQKYIKEHFGIKNIDE